MSQKSEPNNHMNAIGITEVKDEIRVKDETPFSSCKSDLNKLGGQVRFATPFECSTETQNHLNEKKGNGEKIPFGVAYLIPKRAEGRNSFGSLS